MSRSRKKSPFVGHTTAASEAAWKAQVARRVRCVVRQALAKAAEPDALPEKRYAVASAWDGPKDGKQRFSASEVRWMRK